MATIQDRFASYTGALIEIIEFAVAPNGGGGKKPVFRGK
jgi:hypothetical protein